MLNTLKRYFGYTAFRPLQADIIQSVLQGHDVVVLMPTGGGKSLCYQVPALMMEGTTVVVSPLISLMKDQVDALRANGIMAAALNSTNAQEEDYQVRAACLRGELKLLYISPERLMGELPYLLRDMRIALFAIDEAHCISEWGHDFRPEYAQLGVLREQFAGVPVVALTATADRLTRNDIVERLRLRDPKVYISSFDRPNLSLEVRRGRKKADKDREIYLFLRAHQGQSGIIYCMSRNATEAVARMLCAKGIAARCYHAGLPAAEREEVQHQFLHDVIQVVCATVAFGMGIDKSDVRFVIHYNLPKSIESFYQEIGRAGRDGMPATTILYYSLADVVQLTRFADESGQQEVNRQKLERMREYAESGVCRRRILLNYFGEHSSTGCGNCDVCRNPPERFDGTVLAQKALSAVARTGGQATARTVENILRGVYSAEVKAHGYDRLKTFGVGRDVPARDWSDYMMQLLQNGLFEIAYDEHNHLKLTEAGRQVLFEGRRVELAVVREPDREAERRKPARGVPTVRGIRAVLPLAQAEAGGGGAACNEELLAALKALRKRLADGMGLPPYIVMSDKVLANLCAAMPATVEEFGCVSGIGEYKKAHYGKVFVEEIAKYRR